MAIPLITQPDEAATELFRFVTTNPDEFPDDMRETIMRSLEPGKSVSFAVSEGAEMIFARKSELSQDVIKLGATLAQCASYHNINNFGDDNGERGRGIAMALLRHAGQKAPVGQSWPPKEEDPAPKGVYLPEDEQETAVTLEKQNSAANTAPVEEPADEK